MLRKLFKFHLNHDSVQNIQFKLLSSTKISFKKTTDDIDSTAAFNAEFRRREGSHRSGKNFDNMGFWDNKLPLSIHVEQSARKGTLIPRIGLEYAGIATVQGRRNDNEDRLLLTMLNKNLLLLGIFDGHGSSYAADFAHLYMKDLIEFWLRRRRNDLKEVLRRSFLELNNLMARHVSFYCEPSLRNSGTTATVALLLNSLSLVIGHVGDSRAVLCRDGKPEVCTPDDDPGVESEKARIRSRGGNVSTNSLGVPVVNGRLGMTRSLGDSEMKSSGVIAEPHIFENTIIHGRDSFLVMVTDGVTFVMSNQELVDLVISCRTPQEAADLITDQALHFGSEDNASAIVLPFGSWGKYSKTHTQNTTIFARNMLSTRFFG